MPSDPAPAPSAKILVVDDDDLVRRALSRSLERMGYTVQGAADGRHALELVAKESFDLILSDIDMPNLDGLALLRSVREHDLDVPVILITGVPSLESAMEAVTYGAMRYLPKPCDDKVLRDSVAQAVRLHKLAKLKREAMALGGGDAQAVADRAGMEARFASGLAALWMAYQPIVSVEDRRIIAYEALVRTKEPSIPHPGVFFDMAERLGKVFEIGRVIRAQVARDAAALPADLKVFVNAHPQDLTDDELFVADAPLSRLGAKVVLEITERASLDGIKDAEERIRKLRALGFRIALDDLGAGYAGLSTFARLEPDVVKIDMSLVRGIHLDPKKQHIVGAVTGLCREMASTVVGEGVETADEARALLQAGKMWMQGYYFGKPGPGFGPVDAARFAL